VYDIMFVFYSLCVSFLLEKAVMFQLFFFFSPGGELCNCGEVGMWRELGRFLHMIL
jgi:hypothetical protein